MQVIQIKFWRNKKMGDSPNAAQITEGLAKLGGGAKKDGGGGMIKGLETIFRAGQNNPVLPEQTEPLKLESGKDEENSTDEETATEE